MMVILHSIWAYIVLAMLLLVVVKSFISFKKEFTDVDLRLALFTLIVSHIQLLLGLGVYFSSPAFKFVKENGMGAAMKDSQVRLLAVEHPLMMIIAIVLITLGFSKSKKETTSQGKFKKIAFLYGVALLLILSRIPWNQWI
jgi:predicted membrane channel-forming protein YqfA (hemolysin III family)